MEDQSIRRVEKRARDLSEGTKNEVLMLTMGDDKDKDERRKLDGPTVNPLENVDNTILLSNKAGGHMSEEPGTNLDGADGPSQINGLVDENMDLVEGEVDSIHGPNGAMDLSMVPETPM